MVDFDAVVVGAGPAGTAAALVLARGGAKVALLERGAYPGAKNVMGGVMYRHAIDSLEADYWRKAPLERHIIEQDYWLLASDSNISIGHRSEKFAQEPYNRFTVLRGKFDPWFAQQAEEAGAYLLNRTIATDLIKENGVVVGVRTDRPDGDISCHAVIIADGVNSLLAQKTGLRPNIAMQDVALAVKEIVSLPREKIQDRFNLEGEEGATIDIYGEVAAGMEGTGFIYTNKDSLSIGIGVILADLVRTKIKPYELIEQMKRHPAVRRVIAGGQTREYLAHMIPEGGYGAMPKVYASGVLVAGDAAMMVNGFHREGSNLAMTAGRLAAETVLRAIELGDYSVRTMSLYQSELENNFVLKDLRKYRRLPDYIRRKQKEIFTIYPRLMNDAADEFLTIDGVPKKEKQKRIWSMVKKRKSLWAIVSDVYKGWRAFG